MWKLNKSIAKELLPTQPVDFSIEPWWGVCLVNFTLEEFKKLTEEEMAMIDKVCKEEANSFILFDPDIVRGLYRRGLIYFDIPVYADDRFKVSRLEGFVSNREQSYEDPIEELLYAVFVVSSENATVAELAATLQADLSQLQAAASFACRLGWAVKVIDPASILQDSSITATPNIILSDEEDGSRGSISSANMSNDGNSFQQDVSGAENYGPVCGHARVAFIVDANITSYLMMGSVSPGLKSHAVTLYEAGKLGDASIAELCKDLTTLEGTKFEGELQEFANHAYSLRCVLECLQSGGVSNDSVVEEVGAKLGMESSSNDEAISLIADIDITEESSNAGGSETGADGDEHLQGSINSNMPVADAIVESVSGGTGDESVSAVLSENKSGWNEDCELEPKFQTDGKSVLADSLESGKEIPRRKRKYRVDILRCESLAALAPATLDRLFLRDYDIVVSMVPLPSSSVLPGPTGPIHFGPPSYPSMTPWMKLTLYSAVGGGPLSVVLMKGQCLRLLPAPLSGCEKALIWSWDGSTIGGLGGKFEGNLVKGNTLLHSLNSLLKYSAVLVQPLSKYDLDESGRIITMDIPLPLKNADGSSAHIGKEMGLSAEESGKLNSLVADLSNKMELWTIGYIRLLKLYKVRESDAFSTDDEKYEWVPLSVHFGIPLFSPKLCSTICKRVVLSQLLQTDSLSEHHNGMKSLRRRLHDVCVEYQATGSTAKLLYQRQQSRELSRQLITYASGRWNPLVDPSSPISGASSEFQRVKLANRQRCRTEVMSFDGNILRSYALTPVYEAATRLIEDSPPLNTAKIEEDVDSRQVALPGVNILFDGSELLPFDIGVCLQARQPVSLIAEALAASASVQTSRVA
ncbi:protein FAM91A1-like isoform X2 [Telopea speciosissima]|nr:protein FAM91A1-like isoform X2 [Telopea speciosissima]